MMDTVLSSLSLGGPKPFVSLLVLVEVLLADTGLGLPRGGHEALVVDGPGHIITTLALYTLPT